MTDLIERIQGPITSPEDFARKLSDAAMSDAARTPTARPSLLGAAGTTAEPARRETRSYETAHVDDWMPLAGGTSRPALLRPIRLHVAHLDANPPHPLERWLCSWSYRYRRALGDSRLVATRRAFRCANSHIHREVTA